MAAGGTSWLSRNVPVVSWLPGYDRSWLSADAIAGLTVWGLVVPESMAYAGVAGLPPQFGLYTLVFRCSSMPCWAAPVMCSSSRRQPLRP